MTDAETRAKLERIGLGELWDIAVRNWSSTEMLSALRLLAESQQALREIREEQPSIWASSKPDPIVMTCPKCERLIKLAKTACKGGVMNEKYKPSSCGSCKYSNIDTGKDVKFLCLKANREIPGTANTIEVWCPLKEERYG